MDIEFDTVKGLYIPEFFPSSPPWRTGTTTGYPTYVIKFPEIEQENDKKVATIETAATYEAKYQSSSYSSEFDLNWDDEWSKSLKTGGSSVSSSKAVTNSLLGAGITRPSKTAINGDTLHMPKVNPCCDNYDYYLNDKKCILLDDLIASRYLPIEFKGITNCYYYNNNNWSSTTLVDGDMTVGGIVVWSVVKARIKSSYVISKISYENGTKYAFPIGYKNIKLAVDHLGSTSGDNKYYLPLPVLKVEFVDAYNVARQTNYLYPQIAANESRTVYYRNNGGATVSITKANQSVPKTGCICPKYIKQLDVGYNSHHAGYGFYTMPSSDSVNVSGSKHTIIKLRVSMLLYATETAMCPDAIRLFKLDVLFSDTDPKYTISNKQMFENYSLLQIFKGRDGTKTSDGKLEWWFVGDAAAELPERFINTYLTYDDGNNSNTPYFSIDFRLKPIKTSAGKVVSNSIDNILDTIETVDGIFPNRTFTAADDFNKSTTYHRLDTVILPRHLSTITNGLFARCIIKDIQVATGMQTEVSLLASSSSISSSYSYTAIELRTVDVSAFSKTLFMVKKAFYAPTVVNLSNYCFYGSNIEAVCVSSTLNTLGSYAFAYCTNLVHFGYAGKGVDTSKYTIYIPNSITTVGDWCFYHSMTYKKAVYGWKTISKVDKYTDVSLEQIKAITLGNTTKSHYVTIYFGKNIKKIGNCAFYFSCDGHSCRTDYATSAYGDTLYAQVKSALDSNSCQIHRVYYSGTIDNFTSTVFGSWWMDRFWLYYQNNTLVKNLEIYLKTASGVSGTFNIAELNVTSSVYYTWHPYNIFKTETITYDVPPNAFCGCWSLETLTFEKLQNTSTKGLTIGEAAFKECYCITTMQRPSDDSPVRGSLYRLGNEAFSQCRRVTLDSGFFKDHMDLLYLGDDCLYFYGADNTIGKEDFTVHLENVIMSDAQTPVTILARSNNHKASSPYHDGNTISINLEKLKYTRQGFFRWIAPSNNWSSNRSRIYLTEMQTRNFTEGIGLDFYVIKRDTKEVTDATTGKTLNKECVMLDTENCKMSPTTTHIHIPDFTLTACYKHQFNYLSTASCLIKP